MKGPIKQKRHWRKRMRWVRLLALLGILLWVGCSWPTYQPPGRPEVRLRLNYLERVIQNGAAPPTTLRKLTAMNAEWGLFTLSFSTYALANLARRQPDLRCAPRRMTIYQ